MILISRSFTNQKKNDVLIFDHDHLHEGSMITKGVKYIIRGDVLYCNKKM